MTKEKIAGNEKIEAPKPKRRWSVLIRRMNGSGKDYWVYADSKEAAIMRAIELHMKSEPQDILNRLRLRSETRGEFSVTLSDKERHGLLATVHEIEG